MTSKDILSTPEAASLLGCSDVWVIRMIQSGRLEGFRLSGRAWAISRKSVEKSIEEYQQRDPSLPGRKREGSHNAPRAPRAKSLAPAPRDQSEADVHFLSPSELADTLGISPNTVARAARRVGCGIYTHGGSRLAALHPADVPQIKSAVHRTSGNPNWIAARGTGKHSRLKSDRRRKSK